MVEIATIIAILLSTQQFYIGSVGKHGAVEFKVPSEYRNRFVTIETLKLLDERDVGMLSQTNKQASKEDRVGAEDDLVTFSQVMPSGGSVRA